MPLRSLRRRVLAVFGVVAVVASVVVVGSSSVSAKPGKADNPALYSACVGSATDSAGLADVAGTSVEAAVDCLAHYGITRGTSAGVYDAGAAVSRWQMALFLVRAAGPAEVPLGAGADQGFTDIGGLSSDIQTAINQLAELGIAKGISATTFSPDRAVTRGQMALFLTRFLRNATIGPGGVSGVTQPTPTAPVHPVSLVKPDDDVFTDLNQVPVDTYDAIRLLYELGVTKGVSETAFGPSATVTRGQMASFITRALAHTNARPVGVTIQVASASSFGGTISAVVSVRDENRKPPEQEHVDVFTAKAADAGSVFDSEGNCDSLYVYSDSGGKQCEIDLTDGFTDAMGNIEGAVSLDMSGTMWAWTAGVGTKFDNDDHGESVASVAVTVNSAATGIALSTNLPKGADGRQVSRARFGTEVSVTIQLVDANQQAVKQAGRFIRVELRGNSSLGRATSNSKSYPTDADGKVPISFTENDPDTTADSPDATWTVTPQFQVTEAPSSVVDSSPSSVTVTWSDDAPVAAALSVSFPNGSHAKVKESVGGSDVGAATTSATFLIGATPATNTVAATVTDNLGRPVVRRLVRFTSDGNRGVRSSIGRIVNADGVVRRTNNAGVATVSYTRDWSDTGNELITAVLVPLPAPDPLPDGYMSPAPVTGSGTVRWYQTCSPSPRTDDDAPSDCNGDVPDPADATMTIPGITNFVGEVLADSNTILIKGGRDNIDGGPVDDVIEDPVGVGVDPEDYLLASYDANDWFTYGTARMSMEAFEMALLDTLTKNPGATFRVTIEGYYQSDPDKTSAFKVVPDL